MSDQEKENKKTEQDEIQSEQQKDTYRFMDQTIKKRPVDRKAILFRVIGTLGSGIVIGLVAALVFNLAQPALRHSIKGDEVSEKVTFTPDEEGEQKAEEQSDSGETDGKEETDASENNEEKTADLPAENIAEGANSLPVAEEAALQRDDEATLKSGDKINQQKDDDGLQGKEQDQPEAGEQPETPADHPDVSADHPEDSFQKESGEMSTVEQKESEAGADETEQVLAGSGTEKSEEQLTEAEATKQEDTDPEGKPQEVKQPEAGEQAEASADHPEEKTSEEKKQEEKKPEEKNPEENTESGKEKESTEEDIQANTDGITLQEYRQLYRDLMQVADETEHALVQVIGITSEIDYFNQNYENQRRISGLTVARTEEDLFILTEYRVVDQVERIQVVFCDGSMTDATFQKADPNTGLAIIKVPLDTIRKETREEIAVAALGSSYTVQRGDPVLAVGSPLGFMDSVSVGIVTSNGTRAPVADTEYTLLNTDIEGSSDGSGVLIDLDGKIVGVISGSLRSNNACITGLAISQLKEIIEKLSNNESLNYVGIFGQDVTKDITERTGIPRGVLVTGTEEDSPAMLAGIKEYDVIVKIGDQSVSTLRDYYKMLRSLEPDEPVQFTAMRKGTQGYAEVTFEVTVEGR